MDADDLSSFLTISIVLGISIWLIYVVWYSMVRPDSSSALRHKEIRYKKTLLLDMDETLVHSTIKQPPRHHFRLRVHLGKTQTEFFVIKRPYVDKFLAQVCKWYDVYIFTAGVKDYAEPLLQQLDPKRIIHGHFFRDSCTLRRDMTGLDYYVKEFSKISMDPSQAIIIDNQPISYLLNKESAIPIAHFFDDFKDEALMDLLPCLDILRYMTDVRSILGLRLSHSR